MNHPLSRSARGFTLIELLCVFAIVALLATLFIPMVQQFIEKSREIKCAQNLKNFFIYANNAANDNGNRFPQIEVDQTKPIYSSETGAKPLYESLQRYGCSEQDLKCPSDLAGANYYAQKKTSYMWQPFSEDEPTQNITIYTPRGAFPAKLSRVRLCQDWDLPHTPLEAGMRKRMNVLYADGHVVLR
jgi:prepilin-type N-terminal cleavage/methylation domain-containing protein/prepilin-type processing-associated H-X9-DG protein